jgi:hypothetical protein
MNSYPASGSQAGQVPPRFGASGDLTCRGEERADIRRYSR